MKPKMRDIQPQWAQQDGRSVLVLRDPLSLSEKTLALPQPLAPLLMLCNGDLDEDAIHAALETRAGVRIPRHVLSGIVAQLDEALLLENDRSAAAIQHAVRDYRSAPFRKPALAGDSYPSEPGALAAALRQFTDTGPKVEAAPAIRGLVSPHIDFQRGGDVYSQVWSASAEAVRRADIAVIFGTDHMGDFSPFTLTLQNYATPFGMLPTAAHIVQSVTDAIGEDAAFRNELHHRTEHSVELAAVWLHHVREGRPCSLVPILCGSFERFVARQDTPQDHALIARGTEALRQTLQGQSVLVVAAADLAHAGPAFGDPIPAGFIQRTMCQKADASLIQSMCEGNAEAFLGGIRQEDDARHVCGLPPIYLALRLLEPVRGRAIAYGQAPADAENASFVSFCGVAWE